MESRQHRRGPPFLVALAPLLAHCGSGAPATTTGAQAISLPDLAGDFTSSQCEPVGDGTYQLRHYRFTADGSAATWDRFSDPLCSSGAKLVTIVLSGTAKVTGLSGQVLGAADITVSIAVKTITPTAAGVGLLEQTCGQYAWQADTAQVITSGCGALLQETDNCSAEYDLMKLTSAGLVFGDRSHPLCSAATRPTELSAWAVVLDPWGYVSPSTPTGDGPDAGAPTDDGGMPSGNDAASPDGPSCLGQADGLYCGSDGVNGDDAILYQCSSGSLSVVEVCEAGCTASGDGADACH